MCKLKFIYIYFVLSSVYFYIQLYTLSITYLLERGYCSYVLIFPNIEANT